MQTVPVGQEVMWCCLNRQTSVILYTSHEHLKCFHKGAVICNAGCRGEEFLRQKGKFTYLTSDIQYNLEPQFENAWTILYPNNIAIDVIPFETKA